MASFDLFRAFFGVNALMGLLVRVRVVVGLLNPIVVVAGPDRALGLIGSSRSYLHIAGHVICISLVLCYLIHVLLLGHRAYSRLR